MKFHSFRIEITQMFDNPYQSEWWVTVTGSGGLKTKTISKVFATEDEAVEFARSYMAEFGITIGPGDKSKG